MAHPFIPAPNCASVELIYSVAGEIIENTFAVSKSSPFTLAQLQTLRGLFDTWDANYWWTGRSNGVFLTRIRTRALDTATSSTEDYTLPTPRGGAISGSLLPLNVTFCFKSITGLAGRSFRGRIFLPGLTYAQLGPTVNQLLASSASGYITLFNALMTALAAASQQLVVLSYRTNGAWRTTAVATPIISWGWADLNIDSQRRRLAGRGS